MNKYKTTTPSQALVAGYAPITSAYNSNEHELLDRAIKQLGSVPYMLTMSLDGIQICRKNCEINTIKDEEGN